MSSIIPSLPIDKGKLAWYFGRMGNRENNQDAIQRDIELHGPQQKRILYQNNVLFTPSHLAKLIPDYQPFRPLNEFIWAKSNLDRPSHHAKVFLLFSGIPAAGKQEILRALKTRLPSQTQSLITTTTRTRRDNEVEGRDHFFCSVEEFLEAKAAGKFIETVKESSEGQPDRFYGTPKESIVQALNRPEPIITSDVEIGSGWPSVESYVATLPKKLQPKIIKIFTLPKLAARTYFDIWLPAKRPGEEADRSLRGPWEIFHSPHQTDYYLVNPVEDGLKILDSEADAIIEILSKWLSFSL